MGKLWDGLIHTPAKDWVIAIIVGIIIAAILDLLPVGESKIRGSIRWIKNKVSEYSTGQLEKRIKELEKYRDSLKLMIVSCLSWNWRERSFVKITERTYEKRTQALHC